MSQTWWFFLFTIYGGERTKHNIFNDFLRKLKSIIFNLRCSQTSSTNPHLFDEGLPTVSVNKVIFPSYVRFHEHECHLFFFEDYLRIPLKYSEAFLQICQSFYSGIQLMGQVNLEQSSVLIMRILFIEWKVKTKSAINLHLIDYRSSFKL